MTDWQPIDTAPKDGTVIRARIAGYDRDWLIEWVNGGFYTSDDREVGSWVASDEYPPCWTDGAFWQVNEDGVQSAKPTHWQPLPAPSEMPTSPRMV